MKLLMPYQELPFNGDHHIEKEFIRLRDEFNLTTAIETGTCYGSTTMFLADNFEGVITIESNQEYLSEAKARFKERKHFSILFYLGNSENILPNLVIGNDTIFFLDAHWEKSCPLLGELKAIAQHGIKPVIAIHDFKVPNDERFGFDSYNGQDFTFEWIKESLNKIYGIDNYSYHYNTGLKKESAQRGIFYVYPKSQ